MSAHPVRRRQWWEGTATHIVDFYFWKIPTGSQTVGPIGDCPDGVGN
jgi:hypothetical protein